MRRHYDQLFKTLAERDPSGLLDLVDALPLTAGAEIRPLERELTREPMLVDNAFRVIEKDAEWIAHIEAFSRFQKDDPERVAWYGAELVVKYRLPVRSRILLMVEAYDPGDLVLKGRIDRGDFQATHSYQAIKIWEKEAEALIGKGRPHLLPWVALTRIREGTWIQAVQRIAETNDRDVAATFHALGGLRYGKDNWQQMLRGISMIRDDVLEESWVVQEWIQKGEAKGERIGEAKALRRIARRMITARFPALDERIAAVDSITDLDQLEAIVERLACATGEADARRILEALPAS